MHRKKNTRLLCGLTVVIIAFLVFGFFIQKEKEIIINLDGNEIPVLTRCITANTVLKECDISWNSQDFISPAQDRLLKPGDIIYLRKCVPIEIEADGNLIRLAHTSSDVSELMNAAEITLGPLDRVEGAVDKTKLPVRLSVIRVQETFLDIEETVPYPKQRELDPDLPKGKLKILQDGEDGLVRKKYRVIYENGIKIKSQEIECIVLKEAKTEITALGTKGTIALASRSMVNPPKIMQVQATAYTHTGNTTFTGVYPQIGTIAVDPQVIPLGSRVWVEGYGYGIAQDTGGLIKGNIIDLFMDTKQDCLRWGRRWVKVYLLE